MKTLVTGVAGFVGFHVTRNLAESGQAVIGVDDLNDYYDVTLKHARLDQLKSFPSFTFKKSNIADREAMERVFEDNKDITHIIHLAAQAGVRYSLVDPYTYQHVNILGLLVVLELTRGLKNLEHFIFASSSSVYGNLPNLPYSTKDHSNKPISFYGATKKSGEVICHSYSHIYSIPMTCLRFFTVYGPWGRPDMAAYLFTQQILAGNPINVFNHGDMRRDFTYIEDCVAGVVNCVSTKPLIINDEAPFAVYNIGNSRSESLMDFINIIERELGREAKIKFLPLQKGDVVETYANIEDAKNTFGFDPKTNISEGLIKFIDWYRDHHKVSKS